MKMLSTKYLAIGILLVTNSAFAAIILYRDPMFQNIWGNSAKRKKQSVRVTRPEREPKPEVEGSAQIAQRTGVQLCYRSLLMRSPGANEGAVVVNWTIDDQGKAKSVELARTEIHDADFTNCIKEKIQNASFPPAENSEGQEMAHKFNFKTRSPSSIEF